MKRIAAILGVSAVGLFGLALLVFSQLNPEFKLLDDYVSKLGARGEPYSLWWNLIGFFAVGILLTAFGITFGRVLRDRLVGLLLSLFGVGFGATAIPVHLGSENDPASKAHTVAICLGLAAWLFGLARMAHLRRLGRSVHRSANIAATLIILPIVGQGAQLWPMPMTHRLVFLAVFGWVAITSIRLFREDGALPDTSEQTDDTDGSFRSR